MSAPNEGNALTWQASESQEQGWKQGPKGEFVLLIVRALNPAGLLQGSVVDVVTTSAVEASHLLASSDSENGQQLNLVPHEWATLSRMFTTAPCSDRDSE